ncbi:MAG: glycosyltransferase [Betaproteobacteria bacterium]|nr:glycosyltransferase [Betaproteobacteria bacterium]
MLLCIPTLNPGRHAARLVTAIGEQDLRPDQILVIDSGSEDGSLAAFEAGGASIHRIAKREFSHGGTRQLAVNLTPGADIIVFMTQDALLADRHALRRLRACFEDEKVGLAYGRQLPRAGASAIEAHARVFNYPAGESAARDMSDAPRLGIKTFFVSNSFAAYRRSALMAVGGFPTHTILSEDHYVAAKMLLAGWKIVYRADAHVYHSHAYTAGQDFRRYFDQGVFHGREPWLRETFGGAGGEGFKFVRSELRYLLENCTALIPSALLRTAFKLAGFKLGMAERFLPRPMKRALSMHRQFWEK